MFYGEDKIDYFDGKYDLSKPNVDKKRIGKKRIFEFGSDFIDKAIEYMEYCENNEKLANIAGFCVFAKIPRTTFYKQERIYPIEFGIIQDMIEDAAVNTNRTTMGIFYLKNKFGYADKVENKNTNDNVNKNYDLSNLTTEQIKEILRKEE